MNFQELMSGYDAAKAQELLSTLGNNVKPSKKQDEAAFAKVSTGIVASTFKNGDVFKIVGVLLVDAKIAGSNRTDLPAYIIENEAGEQRMVYASSLYRSVPTANSDDNNYDNIVSEGGDALVGFDRGLLQDFHGAFPKITEKLSEAGFIRIDDVVRWSTVSKLQNDQPDGRKAGEPFTSKNVAYRLTAVTGAPAKPAKAK